MNLSNIIELIKNTESKDLLNIVGYMENKQVNHMEKQILNLFGTLKCLRETPQTLVLNRKTGMHQDILSEVNMFFAKDDVQSLIRDMETPEFQYSIREVLNSLNSLKYINNIEARKSRLELLKKENPDINFGTGIGIEFLEISRNDFSLEPKSLKQLEILSNSVSSDNFNIWLYDVKKHLIHCHIDSKSEVEVDGPQSLINFIDQREEKDEDFEFLTRDDLDQDEKIVYDDLINEASLILEDNEESFSFININEICPFIKDGEVLLDYMGDIIVPNNIIKLPIQFYKIHGTLSIDENGPFDLEYFDNVYAKYKRAGQDEKIKEEYLEDCKDDIIEDERLNQAAEDASLYSEEASKQSGSIIEMIRNARTNNEDFESLFKDGPVKNHSGVGSANFPECSCNFCTRQQEEIDKLNNLDDGDESKCPDCGEVHSTMPKELEEFLKASGLGNLGNMKIIRLK